MQITATDGKPGCPGRLFARHPVAPTLMGFAVVEVKAEASESDQLPYDLVATVEPDGTGKLVVTSLVAEQVDGGPPIQRGELAKISVEPFIRFVAAETVMRHEGNEVGLPGPPDEFWDRVEKNGLTDADLHDLARAYRWVRLQEGKPTAMIAEELGLSTATVKRWVGRAVAAGYLTQSERTK
ncbi:helix-turn-helix domain-containing protein [Mycolicibacterium baixiangningiae]|uniref:helix-turn-helix domain-containing protein n=1 Tax=Mycolicibacterium baixiangningiae TaxID=2761578 RepID=UPI001868C524|nr:helix-turn-helix domain-containing protein [Mycolicibacterium baixiangningiae]